MPLPWRKVKSTTISQLVNDHLHKSQKRRDGSSLVVETGFPTSLIDLFIKNREKLKKPSKKKRQNPPNTPISDTNDPEISGSPLPFLSPPPPPSIEGSITPSHTPLLCPSPLHNPLVLSLPTSCSTEVPDVGSSDGGTFVGMDVKEGGEGRVENVNKVFWGVLKMFLVVVLALGTKRLAVGITISAFLLLFLEYVGKHSSGLLKPCLEYKGLLRLMLQSVLKLFWFKGIKSDRKNSGVLRPETDPCSSHRKGNLCPDQEIEVVELPFNLATRVEEIQPVNKIMNVSCLGKRPGYQEIEVMDVGMEEGESACAVVESMRKSRRTKIKLKMKRYITKKFRSSRREQEDDLQRHKLAEVNSAVLSEEQADQYENDGESENGSVSSSISGGIHGEIDGTSEICAFGRLSQVSEEADTKREAKGHQIEAGLTWRHSVLCLIVLIGLIGGRAYALVLTLSWFLLLKFGEKLTKFVKVPLIRSLNDESG